MRFMNTALTFDDVLLVPNYNHWDSRRLVDISSTDKTGRFSLSLPVMSANMDTITEAEMASFMNSKGGIGVLHRFMDIATNIQEFQKCSGPVFVSVGCSEYEYERVEALRDAGAEYFCVDVAHAHSKILGKALKHFRQILPNSLILAGNVATYAGADFLVSLGADIVKVGIGSGSVCTTRIKTGFGIPSLKAIKDCSRINRSIVADGGIRTSGDIVKALAFGADFVMIGGMLAGTSPTPGKISINSQGYKVKMYRGMASREAQEDYLGPLTGWKTAEGISLEVPFREDEDSILQDIIGGLRSGLTYGGANNIKELQRKLDYVIISYASRIESLPHKGLDTDQTGI
jgi:IMP dehydrogenase